MRRGLRVIAGLMALGGLAACQGILGVIDIPAAPDDAGGKGMDAGRDGGADATTDGGRHDTGVDAADAGSHEGGRDDGGHPRDTGVDAWVKPGTTRCTANGEGVETYEADGGWGKPVVCSTTDAGPICLGGQCTCLPGGTECAGQTFERCAFSTADSGPGAVWVDAGVCPGTCTLAGCAEIPPSCAADGGQSCEFGDAGKRSCCTSNQIPGGSFEQSYDGLTFGYSEDSTSYPATVSPFRLDRYEVTVGRFIEFGHALSAGWLPPDGSGKHTHLNGGQGLVDLARTTDASVAYETGWRSAWNAFLKTDGLRPDAAINGTYACTDSLGTLLTQPVNLALPMSCVTWFDAYAFCIWDGGFLPSDAEWNFAAAGGDQQRVYPWSPSLAQQRPDGVPVPTGCDQANYTLGTSRCATNGTYATPWVVGYAPAGDSRWAQADMAGNVSEWTLDVFWKTPPSSCVDCVRSELPPDGGAIDASALPRVQRGGSFVQDQEGIRVSPRGQDSEGDRTFASGIRCARTP